MDYPCAKFYDFRGHIKNIHLHRCKHKTVKLKLTLTLTLTLTDTGGAVLKTEKLQIKTENTNLRLRKYARCIFLILLDFSFSRFGFTVRTDRQTDRQT